MSEMVRRGCLEFSALTVKEAATILELYAATQENTVYNYTTCQDTGGATSE